MGLPFAVRQALPTDLPFIDDLQKKHTKQVGFLHKVVLEKSIEQRHVAIGFENDEPACYLLGKVGYQLKPEIAIVYQACVCYDAQRRHLGQALVDHFISLLAGRAKQLSLWCCQELEANLFWEALGFKAVAVRAGSLKTGRIHVFWCRNLGLGVDQVHFWYPRHTSGGALKAGRVVRALPDGCGWTEDLGHLMTDPNCYSLTEQQVHLQRRLREVVEVPEVPMNPPPGALASQHGDVSIIVGGRVVKGHFPMVW